MSADQPLGHCLGCDIGRTIKRWVNERHATPLEVMQFLLKALAMTMVTCAEDGQLGALQNATVNMLKARVEQYAKEEVPAQATRH